MACETPIIAIKSPGIVEIIDSDSAFLIENDSKELKKTLDENSEEYEKTKLLGKNARKKILLNNEIDIIVEKFIKIYQGI